MKFLFIFCQVLLLLFSPIFTSSDKGKIEPYPHFLENGKEVPKAPIPHDQSTYYPNLPNSNMLQDPTLLGGQPSLQKMNVASAAAANYAWKGSASVTALNNSGATSSTEYTYKIDNPLSLRQSNEGTDYPVRVASISRCPCAGSSKCICGEYGPITTDCPCAPKPPCPPCIVTKSMKQMHQLASNYAREDSDTQETLSKESILEKKLFEMASKYAKDAENQEEMARKASIEVQKYSSMAQISRNKMTRAENQAKQIALDAVRTMTIHPPHEATGVPGMKIEPAGVSVHSVVEKTPYYNIHIGKTDPRGFIDQTNEDLLADLSKGVSEEIKSKPGLSGTEFTGSTASDFGALLSVDDANLADLSAEA